VFFVFPIAIYFAIVYLKRDLNFYFGLKLRVSFRAVNARGFHVIPFPSDGITALIC